jgi:hypothetical protein
MTLLGFILLVVVLGLVWYLLTNFVPMPPAGAVVLNVAFAVILIVALLGLLGVNINSGLRIFR